MTPHDYLPPTKLYLLSKKVKPEVQEALLPIAKKHGAAGILWVWEALAEAYLQGRLDQKKEEEQ